jgi:hypothetical protein
MKVSSSTIRIEFLDLALLLAVGGCIIGISSLKDR